MKNLNEYKASLRFNGNHFVYLKIKADSKEEARRLFNEFISECKPGSIPNSLDDIPDQLKSRINNMKPSDNMTIGFIMPSQYQFMFPS